MYQATDSTYILRLDDGAFIPPDPANIDYQAYLDWVQQGGVLQPKPTPDLEASVTIAVQKRLDDFAHTKSFDGILSACSYASSTVASFASEGTYCVQSRDAHWSTCYQILADVQSGARPVPTVDEVLAEMPALVWPP